MSATGQRNDRPVSDFYPTPFSAFEPLLARLPKFSILPFYDPCAGDGRIVRWIRESGRTCAGAELFPQPDTDFAAQDFLTDFTRRDFIVTNPPFSLAFEFCEHAVRHSTETLFLLRLGFLGSQQREEWFKANEPSALFPLSTRPAFVRACRCKDDTCKHDWILPIESERPKICPCCGSEKIGISTSDSADYAWFYWGHRWHGIFHL